MSKACHCKRYSTCGHVYCWEHAEGALDENGYCNDCAEFCCDGCDNDVPRDEQKVCTNPECNSDREFCTDCASKYFNDAGLCPDCHGQELPTEAVVKTDEPEEPRRIEATAETVQSGNPRCEECSSELVEEKTYTCPSCGSRLCRKCFVKLSTCNCGKKICTNCSHKCHKCGMLLCKACAGRCHKCGNYFCHRCDPLKNGKCRNHTWWIKRVLTSSDA